MITWLWRILFFIVGFIIADYLGIPLKKLIAPIYALLPGLWWAIIALGFVILLLLILIDGARKLHDRTVNEIYKSNEGINKEYADCAATIEILTQFKGRYDALNSLLNNRRWKDSVGPPLSKSEIQCHEADFHNILQDRFGTDYVDDYFGRLGDIPDSVLGQTDRMAAHSNQLHRLIQAERGHQRSIADKANWQRQETLKTRAGHHLCSK